MCGISGFSLNPSDPTITNARLLAGTLLLGIEHRGRDATGACWFDPYDKPFVQKHAVTATAFVRNLSMWKRTTDAILHTRAWTQGSPTNNDNNHPIITGPVIGVHNGGIWNDYELFKEMSDVNRIADVDSEAAFAAIAYGIGRLNNGSADRLSDLLESIQGSAALAWYDSDDDNRTLHLARLNSSPLVVAQNQHGSFFFASTKQAIVDALARTNGSDIVFLEELKEGTYIAVREGRIIACETFTPASYTTWSKPSWNNYSSYQSHTTDGRTFVYKKYDDPTPISPRNNEEVNGVDYDDYDLSSRYFDTEEIFDYDPANIEFDYRVCEKQIDDHDITYGKQMSNSLGASIYPSMWVKTHLLGNEYWGQIIEMPDTFPEGKYTVRMLVTRDGQDMEVVYVQRTVYEMEWEFNSESSNQSTSLLPTYY